MAAVSISSETGSGGPGKGEFMLFGVRVVVDPMRKCVSLNNLSDYEKSSREEEIPKIGDGVLLCSLLSESSFLSYTFCKVTGMPMEQDQVHHAQDNSSLPETNISSEHQVMQVFPVPTRTENARQTFHPNDASSNLVPVTFQANPALNLNTDAAIPSPLSLNLSLSFNLNEQSNARHTAFTNSIIRVA